MTITNDTPDRVQDAVEYLGARITEVTDDGVDFKLDDIDGFARERRGMFRASFFIAHDPDPGEAEQFVAEHGDLPYGEAQFAKQEGASFIRLLVELPFGEGQEVWTTAQTARALRADWLNRTANGRDLVTTLGSAGIALPPLGPLSESAIHTYGAWSWGSRYVPPFVLYMFEVGFVVDQLIEHGRFFALAHAGHGINSYGLNLVTTAGPVAAYVQHGYGGGYANPVGDLVDINATYSRLHVLLGAAEEQPTTPVRWLLAYSQFRGGASLIDLDKIRDGQGRDDATESFDTESDLFGAAAKLPPFEGHDFGTAGSVSW